MKLFTCYVTLVERPFLNLCRENIAVIRQAAMFPLVTAVIPLLFLIITCPTMILVCHGCNSLFTSTYNRPKAEFKLDKKKIWKKHTGRQNYWLKRTRAPDNVLVSEETAARRALLRQQRVKRRKFAMLLAYAGQDYFGFQRNPNVKTVEDVLLNALLNTNYINEQIFNETELIRYVRASRTDKGVSAVGQVVSLRLPVNASAVDINRHLPPEIRVLALVKVTRGFNSRTYSDARTYSYILPTFAFACNATDITDIFRLSADLRQRISTVLALFKGTHNFHNFTPKRFPSDPAAFRTIISFTCEEPFVEEGVEFIILKIKGGSFLLHQIRKMVGLTIAIVSGHTCEQTLAASLDKNTTVRILSAPSVGLLLEQVHYDQYNKKYGSDGIHTSLNWSKWGKELDLFRKKFINPIIIQAEKTNKSWAQCLQEFYKQYKKGTPYNRL